MITKPIKPLLITVTALSVLFFISQFFQAELVFDRSKIESGQWQRLLTGNLTHSNFPHLFLNLAGLWIFTALFIDSINSKLLVISSILLSVAVGCSLYLFNLELGWYYGFSGALYGLYIIGGTTATLNKDLFTGISTIILIIGKISWDTFYDGKHGGSTSSADLIGIPVATDAHLYGVIGACFISGFLLIKHYLKLTHPP